MRTVTVDERRRALVARHHLSGDAASPEDVTNGVVALHASDPASVYLSVLARCSSCRLTDVAQAMYERRSLVRWLAMRRTLFVVNRDDVPTIQAAVSTPLATRLRTQLVNRLRRNRTEPAILGDVADWVRDVSDDVERTLRTRGAATGAELAALEPRLRTTIHARTASERPQKVTTSLLTLLSAEGRIVRSVPTGAWTSRHHRWEPTDSWWTGGLPGVDPDAARWALARRWLERYGPASIEDLQWWTGWTKAVTREVLSALSVEEVDLHGHTGVALVAAPDEPAADPHPPPVAALLPALDPTPMGWKHRGWFFGVDSRELFDPAGNIGPTIWWDGEIIGSWAVAAGSIRTILRADRGADAAAAVQSVAGHLEFRLEGASVTPAARTPLERTLID